MYKLGECFTLRLLIFLFLVVVEVFCTFAIFYSKT